METIYRAEEINEISIAIGAAYVPSYTQWGYNALSFLECDLKARLSRRPGAARRLWTAISIYRYGNRCGDNMAMTNMATTTLKF